MDNDIHLLDLNDEDYSTPEFRAQQQRETIANALKNLARFSAFIEEQIVTVTQFHDEFRDLQD